MASAVKPLLILTLTLLLLITWATAIPSEMDLYQATEERLYFPKLPEHSYIDRRLQDAQLASRAEVDRQGREQRQQAAKRELVMIATAYSPYDDQNGLNSDGDPEHTATGTKPGPGTIAVNPEVIPYGTKLLVIGDGWTEEGVALDTGSAIRSKKDRIDLFRWTYVDAMKFGVQQVRVVALE